MRIAQQISYAFGLDIDKDVVRRVLAKHYHPGDSDTDGPSWLSFIGHAKDSLWSIDLFRVESIMLRSYWGMLVMDLFTRRIIGFGVEPANIDGISVCRMFNRVFFWNAVDLERKLYEFKVYFNAHRVQRALDGVTPSRRAGEPSPALAALDQYSWQQHCRGLFHTPVAA